MAAIYGEQVKSFSFHSFRHSLFSFLTTTYPASVAELVLDERVAL
jgi:hypothetical protein